VAGVHLVLDSGAISAIVEGDVAARTFLREALATKTRIVVPAVVVAESTRGTARDAPANQLLKKTQVEAVSEAHARGAGRLLHATRSDQTIDALIVATADILGGSAVLTADPDDLIALAAVHSRTRILSLT